MVDTETGGLPARVQGCLRELGYVEVSETRLCELIRTYFPSFGEVLPETGLALVDGAEDLPATTPTYVELGRGVVAGMAIGDKWIVNVWADNDTNNTLSVDNPIGGWVNVLLVEGDSPFLGVPCLTTKRRWEIHKSLSVGDLKFELNPGTYEVTISYYASSPQGVDYVLCLRPCRSATQPAVVFNPS